MEKTRIETLFDELADYEASNQQAKALDTVNHLLQYSHNELDLHAKKISLATDLGAEIDLKYIMDVCKSKKLDANLYYCLAMKIFSLNRAYEAIVALACSLSVKENSKAREALTYTLNKLGLKKLSIYFLCSSRIGHLSMEPDSWLRQQKIAPESDTLHLFISSESTCNTALFNMLSRYINIVASNFFFELFLNCATQNGSFLSDEFYSVMPYSVYSNRFPDNSKTLSAFEMHGELCNIYNKTTKSMDMNKEEVRNALTLAKKINLNIKKKFVCLHVRDSAYLNESNFDFSYHDYRDVNIQNYQEAIEHLISNGYQVIRIGVCSNQYLEIEHENYIDLTKRDPKRDISLLELYAFRYCQFYIGMNSGAVHGPMIFDNPILYINCAPFQHYPGGKKTRAIYKKVYQNGKPLNYIKLANGLTLSPENPTKIIDCNNGKEQSAYNIQYIENSPLEILTAVKEFLMLMEKNNFKFSKKQRQYMSLLPDSAPQYIGKSIPTNHFLDDNLSLFSGSENLEKA